MWGVVISAAKSRASSVADSAKVYPSDSRYFR